VITWIESALVDWRRAEVKLNPCASTADIEFAEAELNFQFPDDFKALYGRVNGFQGLDWQEYMFSLWSLEVIVQEYQESSDKLFVGFCDFLLYSHIIGFKKSQVGVFKSYPEIHHLEKNPIARSFEELIHMINSNTVPIY
jgi:hypothetical protein